MADAHKPVPPPNKRSVTNRVGKQHQDNCEDWVSSKKPWPCNAHHLLPVSCFNPIKLTNKEERHYVQRSVWVSEWDINGGNRFPFPKGDNNMIQLPLFSAYKKFYPKNPSLPFKPGCPENKCMHNSRYSEHYIYLKEVAKYLDDKIWINLKENKAQHQGKGKNILGQLQDAEKHFRKELTYRGNRATSKGNKGTKQCWQNKKSDPQWSIAFSMADTPGPGKRHVSQYPK